MQFKSPNHERFFFLLSTVLSLCVRCFWGLFIAGDAAGGQAAAERRRLPAQVGVRLLGEEEEELPRAFAHPADQAGEARRLHQQRRLCGFPEAHGEDADEEGNLALGLLALLGLSCR